MSHILALAGPKNSGKSTIARWLVTQRGYHELALAGELKVLARLLFPRSLPEGAISGPSQERERKFTPEELRRAGHELNAASTWLRLDPEGKEWVEKLFGATTRGPDGDYVGTTSRLAGDTLLEAFNPIGEFLTSPRQILQRLGTEWGRQLDPQVWLRALKRQIEADRSRRYVVSDMRFVNEAEYLRKEFGAQVYWVDARERLQGKPRDAHASEPTQETFEGLLGGVLQNQRDLGALEIYLGQTFPA